MISCHKESSNGHQTVNDIRTAPKDCVKDDLTQHEKDHLMNRLCPCGSQGSQGTPACEENNGCCSSSSTSERTDSLLIPQQTILLPKFSSLQHHIRVLYAVMTCLTFMLVSSIVIFYLEISALREELTHKVTIKEMVELYLPERGISNSELLMPYISQDQELHLGAFLEEEDHPSYGQENVRTKRHAYGEEGSGAADDWTWMSSFARVPIVALKSYCKEARLYCAAQGPAGQPGAPGEKGDTGDKGDKGEQPNESAIAMNLASMHQARGAPGPKGDRGDPGYSGPKGPSGDRGVRGPPGQDGKDGYPGPMGERGLKGEPGESGKDGAVGVAGAKGDRGFKGPPGDRGMSGLPGVPGLKGLPGNVGIPGSVGPPGMPGRKGQPGYCEVQCAKTRRTTQLPEVTTPPPTFPPRTGECSIEIIGKPVFQRQSRLQVGAWMQDTTPSSFSANKIWATFGVQGSQIVEYSSIGAFKANNTNRVIDLSGAPYFGTGHVVYGGFFYYQWANYPKIVRFDLQVGQATSVRTLEDVVYQPTKALKWQGYLYQTETAFIDFNVDRNGLWIIYGNKRTGKMMVALLQPENLDIINAVEIDLEVGSKGNAFIACGKLYTIRHHKRQRSHLDTVHDLWHNTTQKIRINFANPYGRTVMVTFDHNHNKFLVWDSGNQLTVPLLLKFH